MQATHKVCTNVRLIKFCIAVGPVNTFLSWKFFHPMSRLTYSIYMLHMFFMRIKMASTKTPLYSDDMEKVSTVANFFSIAYTYEAAELITVVMWPEMWVLFTWTLGSNPTQGIDVCPCLSILCCLV